MVSLPWRLVGLLHVALSPVVAVGAVLLVRGKHPSALLACAFACAYCLGAGLLLNVAEFVHPLYRGEVESPAFQRVYDDNGWKLYRIRWKATPR